MAKYAVKIVETMSVECVYYVEAETPEEAETLALNGETIDSYTVPCSEEVISRETWDYPIAIENL